MTDRRRNLFVLLLVAGLLVASLAVIVTKPTRLGLDLKGGVSLIYQAKPTKQSAVTGDAINRSLDIMRKRVDQLGVAEPSLQRSGADQIDVSLPDVKNADEAAAQVGTVAQLWFYDWEGSVLGPNCKPDPANTTVTGGPSAGISAAPPALSLFDAVTRGAKCPRTNTGKESSGDKLYLVDKKTKHVLVGPDESRADLERDMQAKKLPFNADQIVTVPQGVTLVRAEQDDPKGKPSNLWYVLKDQTVLGGKDIKNPEQSFDNGAGGTGRRTSSSTSPAAARARGRRSPRSSRSAARSRRSARPPTRPTSTSRSCSTTSSSRRRRSRGRSTRTGSRPAAARRSPAASQSRRLSGWPIC